MNPTLELIARHRSHRDFDDVPLDDETIERVVAAAQHAATSSHVQAYSLLRVTDAARRAELARLCGEQAHIATAGGFFVVCADQRRHQLVAERAAQPCVANLETFLVGVVDASLFAQNVVLGFESLGLGTCYIGGLRNELAAVDRLLELPAGVLPLFGLCVGVPRSDPGQRPRLPLAAIYHVDRYASDADLHEWIADHDRAMAAYYEARGLPGRDWSGGTWRKLRVARRTHLAAFYRAKGAVLE